MQIKPRFIIIATAALIVKLAIWSTEFSYIDSAILMQNSAIMDRNIFQSVLIWTVFGKIPTEMSLTYFRMQQASVRSEYTKAKLFFIFSAIKTYNRNTITNIDNYSIVICNPQDTELPTGLLDKLGEKSRHNEPSYYRELTIAIRFYCPFRNESIL